MIFLGKNRLRMVSGVPAPLCNFFNQCGIDLAIGDADRSLIGFVVLKLFREMQYGFGSRVQSDVPFGRGKVKNIMLFPEGRHTP